MAGFRIVAVTVIAGLLTVGLLSDQRARDLDLVGVMEPLTTPDSSVGTWFCAGGEANSGLADAGSALAQVGLDIANVGYEPSVVNVTILGGDGIAIPYTVPAGSRMPVALGDLAPESQWVGALVETSSPDVLVEQNFEGVTGTARLPCATTTDRLHVVGGGATRTISDGEQMVLVLANPFPGDAVADLRFDSEYGLDSRSAVVVPAGEVVAIRVDDEVTVASRVHVVVEAQAGRLLVEQVQTRANETVNGLSVMHGVQRGSVVSILPSVSSVSGVFDRIYVTNPSEDEVAEVDLEVLITDGEAPDPIELTIRPGRTAIVDIADEPRLAELASFAVRARSLSGVPVAVSMSRQVPTGGLEVPGLAGMEASDGAAKRWLAVLGGNKSLLSIVNPSTVSEVTIEIRVVSADGETHISPFIVKPDRVAFIDVSDVDDRQLVDLHASGPVVVGRENLGFESRQLLSAVAGSELVPLN